MAKKRGHSETYLRRKISRLNREIGDIDDYLYHSNRNDDQLLYAGMLERKRDDMVRMAVLQLHTGIEDILTSWIFCRALGVGPTTRKARERTQSGKALLKMLSGGRALGFDMKLTFAASLGMLTEPVRLELAELNKLRNKCSHNWLLNVPVRRGRKPQHPKLPLLRYKNKNLHDVETLKELVADYGRLYARMFVKYLEEDEP